MEKDQWSWRAMLADLQDRIAIERDHTLEEALLGCLILDPQVIDLVSAKLRGSDFWDKDLGAVFDAMVTLHELKQPVNDGRVLLAGLKRFGLTSGKYGIKAATIAKWLTHVPVQSGRNGLFYMEQVIKLSQVRMQLAAVTKSIDDLVDGRVDPSQSAEKLISRLESISLRTGINLVEIGDAGIRAMERVFKSHKEKKVGGCATGLHGLDSMLGGLHRKELIVIAARPSCGKTALGMQFCYAAALRGERVLFVSIEMTDEELALRLACAFAGVDNQHLRSGALTDSDLQRLRKAVVDLQQLPITICGQKRATIRHIKAAIKQAMLSGPISLVCVDYLQRIVAVERNVLRAEHIQYCTGELKSMADDFDVPMMVLCQLNRGAEDETPSLAHLKESGAIEEDADVVIAIHHGVEVDVEMVPDAVNPKKKVKVEHKRTIDQLIVLKNRNGPRGTIDVKWAPSATRFEDKPEESSF